MFDARIEGRFGSVVDPPKQNIKIPRHEMEPNDDFIEYEDEEEEPRTFFDTNETTDSDGRAVNLTPSYDGLINAELLIYNGEKMEIAKITRRTLGPDGTTAGTYDKDPKLNSMIYEVEFPDGMVKEYSVNVIAQNLLSQIDSEGFSNTAFDSIIDYKKDESALKKKNRFIVTKPGRRKLRKSTVGWKC